jgi:hypothetical protein
MSRCRAFDFAMRGTHAALTGATMERDRGGSGGSDAM